MYIAFLFLISIACYIGKVENLKFCKDKTKKREQNEGNEGKMEEKVEGKEREKEMKERKEEEGQRVELELLCCDHIPGY
jgi:hypothetical protein